MRPPLSALLPAKSERRLSGSQGLSSAAKAVKGAAEAVESAVKNVAEKADDAKAKDEPKAP